MRRRWWPATHMYRTQHRLPISLCQALLWLCFLRPLTPFPRLSRSRADISRTPTTDRPSECNAPSQPRASTHALISLLTPSLQPQVRSRPACLVHPPRQTAPATAMHTDCSSSHILQAPDSARMAPRPEELVDACRLPNDAGLGRWGPHGLCIAGTSWRAGMAPGPALTTHALAPAAIAAAPAACCAPAPARTTRTRGP